MSSTGSQGEPGDDPGYRILHAEKEYFVIYFYKGELESARFVDIWARAEYDDEHTRSERNHIVGSERLSAFLQDWASAGDFSTTAGDYAGATQKVIEKWVHECRAIRKTMRAFRGIDT